MLRQLLSVFGMPHREPLFVHKWLASSEAEAFSASILSGETRSSLGTHASTIEPGGAYYEAIRAYIKAGGGVILIDLPDKGWGNQIAEMVHEASRDADLQLLEADEEGFYPKGYGRFRADQEILIVKPPLVSTQEAPLYQHTLSNLVVELLFDTESRGHGTPTLVVISDYSFELRDTLLSSAIRMTKTMPFQVLFYIADVPAALKSNHKVMSHLAHTVDVAVSKKKRVPFTTKCSKSQNGCS